MNKISVFINENKKKADGSIPVYLRIRNEKGESIFISTKLTTTVKFSGREFPKSEFGYKIKTSRLNALYVKVEEFVYNHEKMSLKDIKVALLVYLGFKDESHGKKIVSLSDYCNKYATTMKASTARLYKLTADRVEEYAPRTIIDKVNKKWLEGYESFLKDKGLSTNGIAQKMRNLRTVFNWCRDEGLTTNYPFKGRNAYKIREEETIPNDLTAQEFANLRDFPCEPWQKIYVDLFCLSVYLGGVNAGDLLLCKGLTNDRFVFVRRKTDKINSGVIRKIELPVCDEAMSIIQKYKGKDYLLNVMDNMKDYHTFIQHWNKALKKIGPAKIVPDKVGKMRKIERKPLFPNITTYTARYTFASIAANDLDISETTIGKCLGHSWAMNSKQVTSRYISHDQKKIDAAIYKIVQYLNSFKGQY